MAEVWRLGDENRDAFETRLLVLLQDELAKKMPGYEFAIERHSVSSGPMLNVSYPELQAFLPNVKASIGWRYKKSSFLTEWKLRDVIGIRVEFDRVSCDNYRSNHRNYGYDFANERLKPDTLQKLVAFIKGESEAKIHRFQNTGKRKMAQKELFQQAASKLKEAGYAVVVSQRAFEDELNDRDVSFVVSRPNGSFEQPLKVLTSGQLSHNLGDVDLKDVANFVGCLEQTLRYIK
jgi:hypothetical protein